MPSLDELLSAVEGYRNEMVEALTEMLRIPAIGPESGGEGEFERARYIRELAEKCGFEDVENFDALDERVRLRSRPNITLKRKGSSEQTVWIVSHMDTVPPGDLDAWTYPPFSPKVVEGKLYGLGAEDNGQSLIGSLFAARVLNETGIAPERSMALAIVSDEEMGSDKGIKFMIKEGVFRQNDFIDVPDFGEADGSLIEVAEKHILWLKINVKGRQTHASTPEKGINATRIGNEMANFLSDYMHQKYAANDPMLARHLHLRADQAPPDRWKCQHHPGGGYFLHGLPDSAPLRPGRGPGDGAQRGANVRGPQRRESNDRNRAVHQERDAVQHREHRPDVIGERHQEGEGGRCHAEGRGRRYLCQLLPARWPGRLCLGDGGRVRSLRERVLQGR